MTRVLGAALVALVVAGCGGSGAERLVLPPGQTFVASATLAPTKSAFGDELTARVRVLLDRDRVDPETIRVSARFSPFRDVTTVERVDSGNLTALLYTYKLLCLTSSCVPPGGLDGDFVAQWGGRITSDLGPVLEFVFPEVRVAERVEAQALPDENTGEVEQWPPRWRATVALPEPSFGASPRALSLVLGALGVLLVLGSAAAAWLLLRRGSLLRAPEVSPLDRALDLLRTARTDEERRAALEALALALDSDLASPARALAWGEPAPTPEDAEQLASLAGGGAR